MATQFGQRFSLGADRHWAAFADQQRTVYHVQVKTAQRTAVIAIVGPERIEQREGARGLVNVRVRNVKIRHDGSRRYSSLPNIDERDQVEIDEQLWGIETIQHVSETQWDLDCVRLLNDERTVGEYRQAGV